MVTYVCSNFRKLLLWSHTNTYGLIWMSIVAYGFSDSRRLHMVAYGYIRISMVTYGFTDFRRLFMVAYGYIWTHMDAYGRLYSQDLWPFLISLCSVRFCDFKFNMATYS